MLCYSLGSPVFGSFGAVRSLIWFFFNQFMAELIGPRLYCCSNCRNQVSLHDDIISKAFHVNLLFLSLFYFFGWFWDQKCVWNTFFYILSENYVIFYSWLHRCIYDGFVANWNHHLPILPSTTWPSWFFKRVLNIIVSRCHYYYKGKVGKFQGDFKKGKKFELMFCNWG